MARFAAVLLSFLAVLGLSTAKVPETDTEVIIIGGGPAGLSALSSVTRVSRRAVLFDSSEYRNAQTRNMHDVIGADGYAPHEFRDIARKMINKYDIPDIRLDTKIQLIDYKPDEAGNNVFYVTDSHGNTTTGRKLILATGVTDIIPDIDGFKTAYGKGMYWCPWCDGFEHRGQSLAVVGLLSDSVSSVLEMHNINPDTIILADGSNTQVERDELTKRTSKYGITDWQKLLNEYNVDIVDAKIQKLVRLKGDPGFDGPAPPGGHQISIQDDDRERDPNYVDHSIIPSRDDAGPNGRHYDLFRIEFADDTPSIERAALLVNMGVQQTSGLPQQLRRQINADGKVVVNTDLQPLDASGAAINGLYAIGDMNNEGATNVPHAMYNGKKVAVKVHVALARENARDTIASSHSKRSLSFVNDLQLERITMEQVGNDMEALWEKFKSEIASR